MTRRIAVIGAGTMGAGIAQLAATHRCSVCLIDVQDGVVRRSLERIESSLARWAGRGRLADSVSSILERIQPGAEVAAVSGAELVIEAVVEDLEIKRQVFQQMERFTDSAAVLATNTSSLSVTRIAEAVGDPSRVVGMHFFNPAPVMPLVEVVAGQSSSDRAVNTAKVAVESWGKTAVLARDVPGFIVNRVARGYYLEALRLLDEGVAGVNEIDDTMTRHGHFRMGPFTLMDLVGLDVNLAVSRSVWEQLGRPARLEPHPIQANLVSAQHLGRKTGRGFYLYDGDQGMPAVEVRRQSFDLSPLLSDAVSRFAQSAGATQAGTTEQFILARILGSVLNEAAMAWDDRVASIEDIDTAMVLGTNYPKGPFAWMEEIGPRTVRGLLKLLDESSGKGRYPPAAYFSTV